MSKLFAEPDSSIVFNVGDRVTYLDVVNGGFPTGKINRKGDRKRDGKTLYEIYLDDGRIKVCQRNMIRHVHGESNEQS